MFSWPWLVLYTHGACIFVAGVGSPSYFPVAAEGCVRLTTEQDGSIIQTRRKHVCRLLKPFAMHEDGERCTQGEKGHAREDNRQEGC